MQIMQKETGGITFPPPPDFKLVQEVRTRLTVRHQRDPYRLSMGLLGNIPGNLPCSCSCTTPPYGCPKLSFSAPLHPLFKTNESKHCHPHPTVLSHTSALTALCMYARPGTTVTLSTLFTGRRVSPHHPRGNPGCPAEGPDQRHVPREEGVHYGQPAIPPPGP